MVRRGSRAPREALQKVPSATSAAAMNKLRPVLEKLRPALERRAQEIVEHRSKEAMTLAAAHYDNELSRLRYLQSVNPLVRKEELSALSEQRETCSLALAQTQAVLEGLRVCVAV